MGGLWREVNYSDSVNAQRMRPYMPGGGGVGEGDHNKRGTTVFRAVAD